MLSVGLGVNIVVAALLGQLNNLWLADPTSSARLLDSLLYGAIVGSGVGLALLSAPPSARRTRDAVITALAAAAAGALLSTLVSSIGAALNAKGGTTAGLGLQLVGCVAFGAAVALATGAVSRFGLTAAPEGRAGCCSMMLGGAIGGFLVWLVVNALRGVLSLSTFAYWETSTDNSLARVLADGLGAGLPTLIIAAAVVVTEAGYLAWRS
ncbi:MAG: hypothetical protein ACKV2O_03155 [Acidimicrobiales bacterium]